MPQSPLTERGAAERPAPARLPRVLIVHNRYQQPGGEDAVVDAEEALLRQRGHVVHRYGRHNDDIGALGRLGRLALARDTVWSGRTVDEVGALLERFRPDVVHAHNTFPLISPSLYTAARRAGVPVVQTLHNFRLLCPQAMLLREGRICEDCVGRVPWRAVAHRCYRQSAPQSAVVATMLQVHRAAGTWRDQVTLYIALNDFCRAKFVQGGLPAERLRVKPNFIDLPKPPVQRRAGLLFVGRLSEEKGIDVLARALALTPPDIAVSVAGEGPLRQLLEAQPRVALLGRVEPEQVYEHMRRATALVMPSIWYENFPRTVVEAFANGLPVIASRLGAMADLIEDGQTGLLFQPGDAADLAAKLQRAASHPEEMARMGAQARRHYDRHLTGESTYRQLQAIYAEAMALHDRASPDR